MQEAWLMYCSKCHARQVSGTLLQFSTCTSYPSHQPKTDVDVNELNQTKGF